MLLEPGHQLEFLLWIFLASLVLYCFLLLLLLWSCCLIIRSTIMKFSLFLFHSHDNNYIELSRNLGSTVFLYLCLLTGFLLLFQFYSADPIPSFIQVESGIHWDTSFSRCFGRKAARGSSCKHLLNELVKEVCRNIAESAIISHQVSSTYIYVPEDRTSIYIYIAFQ